MANVSTLYSNITLEDLNDIYTTYGQYKASELIWQIVPPIILIIGTFGNCLSILVLTRRSIRSSTTALFLTVLAFSDLLVLYSGLLRQWLLHIFNKDVRHVSVAGCKINIWLVYSSLDFSAWILIVVTLERLTSAWFPHRAKRIWTKTSAVIIMLIIGIFILGLNSHLLYGMIFKTYYDSYRRRVTVTKCVEIDNGYFYFFNNVWPWIDLCAFCLIPFFVIVIGNALLLYKVIQSQNKSKSRVVPSVDGERHPPINSRNKNSSMTAMLFTLNIVFLITTCPVSIYNIGYSYWIGTSDAIKLSELDLWWAITNVCMYMNNSLNFLLYCLSGTKFRREVINIFCSKRPTGVTNDVMMTQSKSTRTKFGTSKNSDVEDQQIHPEGSSDLLTKFYHNNQSKDEAGQVRSISFIENRDISSKSPKNSRHSDSALLFGVGSGVSVFMVDDST